MCLLSMKAWSIWNLLRFWEVGVVRVVDMVRFYGRLKWLEWLGEREGEGGGGGVLMGLEVSRGGVIF